MTDKKKKIMSLSVSEELQRRLKTAAKKMGWSVSQLIRQLVDEYLDLLVNDNDNTPIVLNAEADTYIKLREASTKMECSISDLVCQLVDKHLDLLSKKDDKIPVILRIPKNLNDEESIRNWLNPRVNQIVKSLTQ